MTYKREREYDTLLSPITTVTISNPTSNRRFIHIIIVATIAYVHTYTKRERDIYNICMYIYVAQWYRIIIYWNLNGGIVLITRVGNGKQNETIRVYTWVLHAEKRRDEKNVDFFFIWAVYLLFIYALIRMYYVRFLGSFFEFFLSFYYTNVNCEHCVFMKKKKWLIFHLLDYLFILRKYHVHFMISISNSWTYKHFKFIV